jgi:hypothetical protein
MEENERGRSWGGDKKQEKLEHKEDEERLFLYNFYFNYP